MASGEFDNEENERVEENERTRTRSFASLSNSPEAIFFISIFSTPLRGFIGRNFFRQS